MAMQWMQTIRAVPKHYENTLNNTLRKYQTPFLFVLSLFTLYLHFNYIISAPSRGETMLAFDFVVVLGIEFLCCNLT